MAKSPNDSSVLRASMPLPEREPRKRSESTAQAEILAALNRLPGVRVARNNVGRLQDRNGTWVAYGLGVGSPDIVGIYTTRVTWAREASVMRAIAFGVEVKSATGRVREEQAQWHAAMARRGLPTFVARSADEAVRQVEIWCAEIDGAL
jgi:hypothetical protein